MNVCDYMPYLTEVSTPPTQQTHTNINVIIPTPHRPVEAEYLGTCIYIIEEDSIYEDVCLTPVISTSSKGSLTSIMNMCIVMNMNIYIRPDLEKRLREAPSMSGLINNLLERHFLGTVDGGKTQEDVVAEIEAKIYDTPKIRPLVEVIDDEPEEDFYATLILDTVAGGVFDTEDGERVDADPEMIKELKKRGQVR